MKRFKVVVVTDGSGAATVLSPRLSGKIHSIQYAKDGTLPYTDGVDFAITAETTGDTVWTEPNVNAAKTCYPRAAVHSPAGVAALYAASGTAVTDKVGIVDRLRFALLQGGANKTGTFHILVD